MSEEGISEGTGNRKQGTEGEDSSLPNTQHPTPNTQLYAGIDVGTNSVKMIVADLADGRAERIFEQTIITRLGEGMQAQGNRLREAAMRRTLDALAELVAAGREHQAQAFAAVGTAALRDAENRDEFLARAQERLGLNIDVIPGQEEARLSYLAVRRDPHWRSRPLLRVIDIGGGSTEIIQGTLHSSDIAARISVNYGAVKLTEQFLRSDPPTVQQLQDANAAVLKAFERIDEESIGSAHGGDVSNTGALVHTGASSNPSPAVSFAASEEYALVGVGGTVTNLGSMDQGGKYGPEPLHGHLLTADQLGRHIELLASSTVAQREQIPGLDPRRADIILGGAILLSHAMARLSAPSIAISTRGLRWGLVYDRFQEVDSRR